MADDNERRLPIKIVIPQDGDVFSKDPGGSRRRVFGEVDRGVRQSLLSQLGEVRSHFAGVLQSQDLPAVARVVLKEESLAKSHRPRRLFNKDTCPVIGSQTFGQLLVSIDAPGLSRLENQIEIGATRDVEADISTVSRIEPYTAENALGTLGLDGISSFINSKSPEKLRASDQN